MPGELPAGPAGASGSAALSAMPAGAPTTAPPLAPAEEPSPGAVRRLAARFALVAFGLYHLPLALNNYPTLGGGKGGSEGGLAVAWGQVFGQVGLGVARHVFGVTADVSFALSGDNGDSVEEYCRALVAVVVAAMAAGVWTFADRRRPRGRWVEGALHVMLRYAIALGLASYAIAKLYPVQFWHVPPARLEARVGELSPMQLVWVFMGHSRVYSTISGIMELTVVVLLCFRRTALLGALVCVPVMLNVMLLNLCYGVVVKLYATTIVVSALVLVVYDTPRLASLLVWHRSVPARPIEAPFSSSRLNQARWVVKLLLVGSVILSCLIDSRRYAERFAAIERSPLYGLWDVTSVIVDGRELARSTEPLRWRRVATNLFGIAIRFEDGQLVRCSRAGDDITPTLKLSCPDTHQDGELRWARDGNALRLDGTFDKHRVSVLLTWLDQDELPLQKTRFRWTMDD